MITSKDLERCASHFADILEALSSDSQISHIISEDVEKNTILLTLVVEPIVE